VKVLLSSYGESHSRFGHRIGDEAIQVDPARLCELVVGNFRSSGSISAAGRQALGPFWEYAAFVANSLIFLTIGAQEAQQHFKGLWVPVLLAIGNARTCGCHLSAVHVICSQLTQGGYAAPARAFLGRAAGRFGARAAVIPARGSSPARSHRSDYLCRRGLLCVRARINDYPALAPPGANQIVLRSNAIPCPDRFALRALEFNRNLSEEKR
jgi:hypothetical protein